MIEISTRLAEQKDIGAVAELFDAYRRFYEQPADLPLATAFLQERFDKHESVLLVAENEAREILGFCQLYPTFCSVAAAPIYVLYDLFVKPEARNCGAGRALLLAAERHAVQNGFARMELTTAKTNLPAQALYESLGWKRDENFYSYSKETRSLMRARA
jgi:ribosomal protein S18 acetylase RimI-like enzyme